MFYSLSSFDFRYLSISIIFLTSLRETPCEHIGQLSSVSKYLLKKEVDFFYFKLEIL